MLFFYSCSSIPPGFTTKDDTRAVSKPASVNIGRIESIRHIFKLLENLDDLYEEYDLYDNELKLLKKKIAKSGFIKYLLQGIADKTLNKAHTNALIYRLCGGHQPRTPVRKRKILKISPLVLYPNEHLNVKRTEEQNVSLTDHERPRKRRKIMVTPKSKWSISI